MHRASGSISSIAAVLLMGMLVLTGCRTYGGHGSEEAHYRQIQEGNRLFAEELQRASTELGVLADAAQNDARLVSLQEAYASVMDRHQALLASHREYEERVSPGSRHQDLRRILGKITAEQRLVRDQYFRVLQRVAHDPQEVEARFHPRMFDHGMYATAPSFFRRVENRAEREQLTMRRALATAAEFRDVEIDDEIIDVVDPIEPAVENDALDEAENAEDEQLPDGPVDQG